MLIRDILTSKHDQQTRVVAPDAALTEAVGRMAEANIGSLVVMDGERLAGMLTERDVARALHRLGADIGQAKVAEVMNPKPTTAAPDDTVDYMRGVMTDSHVTHVVVVERERVRGVISFHDIARGALSACNFENLLMKRYIKNWPE